MIRRQNITYVNKSYDKDEIRRGDWICLVCHNHNFSFRKFCNRCQNQSRRDNELQTTLLRKRIDMQINMELQASYNTFPRALFLTLGEYNCKIDQKLEGKQIKLPSLSFIDDIDSGDSDHCQWVRSMLLQEESDMSVEANKQNVYFCGGNQVEKVVDRSMKILTATASC